MTRGSNTRPTRRVVTSERFGDEYVIELGLNFLNIRPKGARRGGPAEITVLPGTLYVMLFEARRHKAGLVRFAKRNRRAR